MLDVERELALRPQVLDEFQEILGQITASDAHDLPDLQTHIEHNGNCVRPDIQLNSGLYLDKAITLRDARDEQFENYSFLPQPGHRLGREQSHNGVLFGKMVFEQLGKPGFSAEAQIAVKPSKDHAAVLGELAMFQYLRTLGIPTFSPTGLLVTDGSSYDYLFTRFEKPVATMDTVDWDELDVDEKWLQLDYAVQTMALLNSQMLFHGDLEFRNVAFGERGDDFVVDPEFTVSLAAITEGISRNPNSEEVQRARLKLKQCLSKELTSVCISINEFIISSLPDEERPKTDAAKFKKYMRHLFKPYRQALLETDSIYLPELLLALDKVSQEHKQRSRS